MPWLKWKHLRIEDMWTDIVTDKYDVDKRRGSTIATDSGHCWVTCPPSQPKIPKGLFTEILPESLRQRRVLDDFDLGAEAEILDEQVRDFILDERFDELRDVQVRRRREFTESFEDVG